MDVPHGGYKPHSATHSAKSSITCTAGATSATTPTSVSAAARRSKAPPVASVPRNHSTPAFPPSALVATLHLQSASSTSLEAGRR
eukprot:CAMPEP_0181218088 /NCGR_PEP_ID=MMETSP1096-20121128/27501_1 /TAXON_ID=156174 ORGANISM="Chrysochromulina ericina, Strain CCMP281" /NCGR_SAMPLE_ID=MMETSP1096 /ASSEMBLY_ACC=CAM_ASM_000453 /LENGTH=84 /DNA_ID=CAMNT_0023310269 /DNA_START=320 /DNA_END=574 /DNA_ORIENTATION=+